VDVTQALRDTENALRDFIAATLERVLGRGWLDSCGVTPERISIWRDRQSEERRRQEAGVVEERLLYYADFYDLKPILKKHWSGDFSEALGAWKRFEVLFDELFDYRNPDAHRRELLPHQQSFALGIEGDIRSRLIRWRSRRERLDDCFPRIESARDSLGNLWIPSTNSPKSMLITETVLRPGDKIDFVVTARDPEGLPLAYSLGVLSADALGWQDSGVFSLEITEAHISADLFVELRIKSPRSYHASTGYDDRVRFCYSVLPRRL
jgi:Swt1-like HEPN